MHNLKFLKVDRINPDKPGVPKLISEDNLHLWFKQDDTFDQPFVLLIGKIYTNDSGYPLTTKSIVLANLW